MEGVGDEVVVLDDENRVAVRLGLGGHGGVPSCESGGSGKSNRIVAGVCFRNG
jgi:hypothetical protein